MKSKTHALERIAGLIVELRGQRVLLDSELAQLYGVSTKALNQAVKRNQRRFPNDFMFRLSRDELTVLNRSQVVTGSQLHRKSSIPTVCLYGTRGHYGRDRPQ